MDRNTLAWPVWDVKDADVSSLTEGFVIIRYFSYHTKVNCSNWLVTWLLSVGFYNLLPFEGLFTCIAWNNCVKYILLSLCNKISKKKRRRKPMCFDVHFKLKFTYNNSKRYSNQYKQVYITHQFFQYNTCTIIGYIVLLHNISVCPRYK